MAFSRLLSTCRRRRVKCDEGRPACKNCIRVKRECHFAVKPNTASGLRDRSSCTPKESKAIPDSTLPTGYDPGDLSVSAQIGIPTPDSGPTQPWVSIQHENAEDIEQSACSNGILFDDSLFEFGDLSIPNSGLVEWYDLLAEDAINNLQERKHGDSLSFEFENLYRRQIPKPPMSPETGPDDENGGAAQVVARTCSPVQPWNTKTKIGLLQEELIFFEHYVNVVAPILDMFDPLEHFAKAVPDIALRNEGLLKSLLAVGASHLALCQASRSDVRNGAEQQFGTPTSTSSLETCTARAAEHYYHETLHYLSQNIVHPAYRNSNEILVTAIMISTYGMFDAKSDYSNWDRHLRRAFWIQRDSGVSGESSHGLQRAVWCAWLQQDIWAAFCTGRPTLTLHQPNAPLSSLSPDALHQRIIYLAAKCVQFAATPKKGDVDGYIEAGETLLRRLEAWRSILPSSFEPVSVIGLTMSSPSSPTETSQILPIWIHPPANAAAIQIYHFARIITVLNQPSMGGLNAYQKRFKLLRESASVICGIAVAQQSQNIPSAFFSFQAVHAAALCVESHEMQAEILGILHKLNMISKHPHESVLSDLVDVWDRVISGCSRNT